MWKLSTLLQSRRFWAAIVGVLAIAANDTIGISEDEARQVGNIVIAWILGDAVRTTGLGRSIFFSKET